MRYIYALKRIQSSKKDRASAAVEFALIAPLFIFIALFMIDAGRVFYVKSELLNAASQGAREAAVGGSSSTVISVAQAAAPGVVSMANSSDSQVTVTINTPCPTTLTPDTVQMAVVTASINFAWTTPLALIKWFVPSTTRAGTVLASETSQWLCTN